ncbi:MAG TPA: hypothetical protein VKG65_10540 [Terriglobales bacterium]|nr:hypothetical protein [Terriglobales bacterium]
MSQFLATRLLKLEASKLSCGRGCAARVETLLTALRGARFDDAESLIRFHDALLFLRAFPQSRKVVQLTESLLAGIGQQVAALRESGADMEMFHVEQFSGIAGMDINDTFTYEVARWLAQRYPRHLSVAWDFDDQGRQMAVALPRFIPLLADDSLVEADTPYLDWMGGAAGGEQRILPWLLQLLEDTTQTMLPKTTWYDALKINVSWHLGATPASRTHARRNPREMFFHREPLIRRNQVSLDSEMESSALPIRKLKRREGEELLDMVRDALTVRYRELYGTTRGDPESVVEADAGRGVHIFLWGLPPDRRLPLRAYHAGFTLKNGVPINYIEGISLFDWMEVGFNTFYAFRDGESAWIYSKVLRLLHQLTNVTCFSVYPYQLGDQNEEAIKSGAFWFYRKLGFRPGRPELLAMTQREEAKMAKKPSHRTSARTLRKLAAGHVFYEFGDGPRGLWDAFSARNIGLAVQQRMAKEFNGDPESMCRATSTALAVNLKVDPRKWSTAEQTAFKDFAFVLSLVPEVKNWTANQKQALIAIIRAKAAEDESAYLRLLQQHEVLKKALVRLGSSRPGDATART